MKRRLNPVTRKERARGKTMRRGGAPEVRCKLLLEGGRHDDATMRRELDRVEEQVEQHLFVTWQLGNLATLQLSNVVTLRTCPR